MQWTQIMFWSIVAITIILTVVFLIASIKKIDKNLKRGKPKLERKMRPTEYRPSPLAHQKSH